SRSFLFLDPVRCSFWSIIADIQAWLPELYDILYKYPVALECGFDISPETLYEKVTGKKLNWLN
ncbi:MAG: hypothetical protein KZQ83_20120, partial [gamma proteobacterium symbiont of Taylorina sp.]|nr:hypothetical protein [gamma proteobacterium symbiont of Taylorina sp.]